MIKVASKDSENTSFLVAHHASPNRLLIEVYMENCDSYASYGEEFEVTGTEDELRTIKAFCDALTVVKKSKPDLATYSEKLLRLRHENQ